MGPICNLTAVPRAVQESLSSPIDRRSDYYRQRAREQQPHSQAAANAKPQPLLTAPNVLTFLRLLMVPVLVVLWFLPHRLAPLAAALTFIFAAITDWADGYLARRVRAAWPMCLHTGDLSCTQYISGMLTLQSRV